MSFLDALRHRLTVLRQGEAYADEQTREVEFHLELAARRHSASDVETLENEMAARRAFGNVTRYREAARDMSSLRWLDRIRQDLGYAWRGLRRSPGFAIAVIVTLGLGVGLNAAVFSLLDRLFLRAPAGVAAPKELRRLYVETAGLMSGGQKWVRGEVPFPVYTRMAAVLGESQVGGYTYSDSVSIGTPTEYPAKRSFVSATFFPVLGVRLRLGRSFTDAESQPSQPTRLVVISEDLWRRVFGQDPSIVGHTTSIDGETFTIIGVAGDAFTGVDIDRVDVWIPLGNLHGPPNAPPWYEMWGGFERLRVVTRISEGVVLLPLEEAITVRLRADAAAGSGLNDLIRTPDGPIVLAAGPMTRDVETAVALRIAAISLIVLLIACANVANLLLLRGAQRSRETAVRRALGGSRARLSGQVLIESLLLAFLVSAAAVTIAFCGGILLRRLLFPSITWSGHVVDLRLMAILATIALVAGVIAGVVPALAAANPDVMSLLRRGSNDGGSRGATARSTLVMLQSALSVALLVGATLFIRSLLNAEAIGVGYDTREVARAWVDFIPGEKSDVIKGRVADFERIANEMRSFPGVRSTAMASTPPLGGIIVVPLFRPGVDSLLRIDHLPLISTAVTRGYFETAGVPLIGGRTFTDDDIETAASVMVVSRRMANAVWPGESAIGHCLILRLRTNPCVTIVGVVEDTHVSRIVEEPTAHLYVPFGHTAVGMIAPSIVVRAAPASLSRVTRELRVRLTRVVPKRRPVRVTTLAQVLEPELRPWLVGAQLFTAIGALALIVAAVGVFSVVSYAMSQRAHEIGVRLALGARRGDIFRLAARNGLGALVIGAALGDLAAAGLTPFLSSLLFGVNPADPTTFIGAAIVLVAVGVLAILVPARRASKLDFVRTLAAE